MKGLKVKKPQLNRIDLVVAFLFYRIVAIINLKYDSYDLSIAQSQETFVQLFRRRTLCGAGRHLRSISEEHFAEQGFLYYKKNQQ